MDSAQVRVRHPSASPRGAITQEVFDRLGELGSVVVQATELHDFRGRAGCRRE